MTGLIKKIFAILLTMVIFITSFVGKSLNVQASARMQFADVISANVPLRNAPYKNAEVLSHTYEGRVLSIVSELSNECGNLWYEVAWENEPGDGKTAYIYSGNVKNHRHSYFCQKVEGVVYGICECGDVHVEETTNIEISHADTLVLGMTTKAGAISLADGPIPVGDMIGIILIVGTWCLAYSGVIPDELEKVTTETDFIEYIRDNGEVCADTNFRMVARNNGILEIIDDYCLSIPQAYIYARYCKGDVWTPDESGSVAMACASLNGEYFGPEVDKNKPGYYYHYHMGADHSNILGGHIFYGRGQFNNCIPVGV